MWGILRSTCASMTFWKKNRLHAGGSQSKRTLVRSSRLIVSGRLWLRLRCMIPVLTSVGLEA